MSGTMLVVLVSHECRADDVLDPLRAGHFVTGGALGVRCTDRFEFFPDIYNEDWFFLVPHATVGGVALIGEARQRAFDPFADPHRATFEEFGDLPAEGLFAAFSDQKTLSSPPRDYWGQ
jgi:hypothetical protein